MSFVDFVVLPPGHGRSATNFWGWDAHEVQLRCPDGVWVVIEEDVVPGGALNLSVLKCLSIHSMISLRILNDVLRNTSREMMLLS